MPAHSAERSRLSTSPRRVRCRNQRCRSKLAFPTDGDHKAFCSPYCYDQHFKRRCRVCEDPLQRPQNHCQKRTCRSDFRRYRHAYSPPDFARTAPTPTKRKPDAKNPCGTGTFFRIKERRAQPTKPSCRGLVAPSRVIDTELGRWRKWEPTVSTDGVVSYATHVGKDVVAKCGFGPLAVLRDLRDREWSDLP
jgi:hypothetical protein